MKTLTTLALIVFIVMPTIAEAFIKGDARDNDHRKHLAHKISSARDRVNFGPL